MIGDWDQIAWVVAILVMVLAFAGDPDLMDALIKRIGGE
jgi:hypothetical protein